MKLQGTANINSLGHLEIGGCDSVELARQFGTPLYVMDEMLIRQTCREYMRAFCKKPGQAEVIYASKAFLTTAMCRIIDEEGLGLDVVSGGELFTALQAQFPPNRIYFHGNNKSPGELAMAIEAGIGRIIVDNFYEMAELENMAARIGKRVDILLRITPGIEAHTHEYIKTGQIDSKFGFTLPNGTALEAVRKAQSCRHLKLRGIHCHIGSQIFEMDSYRHAVCVMMGFMAEVLAATGHTMEELNLGGGFGIYYTSKDTPATVQEYGYTVMETVRKKAAALALPEPKVIVEPGRSIVGPAGTTLYTIGSIKEIPGVRKYVAVDGGMGDNIRPALYGAKYEAMLANKAGLPGEEVVSITGKCCESGDMLIWDVHLPACQPGDILAVSSTGAYCYTMSSNYNRLGRPAVVLVREGEANLIVKRETYEDLLRNDLVPDRLLPQKMMAAMASRA